MAWGEDGVRNQWPPHVRDWLQRLDAQASVLPDERRTELRAGVEEYLADAVRGTTPGPDRDRAADRAVAELGPPEALVAEAGRRPPSDAEPRVAPADGATPGSGPPWLEVATVTLLVASVVLALVPATEELAPAPWFVGTLLVLLSRRWTAGDKALAVGAFGVLGVPLVLLGRDELPAAASVVVSVLLVLAWAATGIRLLARARSPRDQGQGLRMR